jgi:hypothetical protein
VYLPESEILNLIKTLNKKIDIISNGKENSIADCNVGSGFNSPEQI